MAAFSKLTWIGLAAAAVMVVGAFGPWIKTLGIVNVSVTGTDGGKDGWGVVPAAVIGALALFAWERRNRLFAIGTLLAGGASTVLCFTDRQDVTGVDTKTDLASIEVGWGLNLAFVASAVLAIVGVIALRGKQNAPDMKPIVEPSDG